MGRLKEYLSEDSNQYGPGTDLMVSLMAFLMVISVINGFLYQKELAGRGADHFRIASNSFYAADFEINPYWQFSDEKDAMKRIEAIALEYKALKVRYPYIFVIGHASTRDIPNPPTSDPADRWERNWKFAGERATRISRFLQVKLDAADRDKLIVVSTGEFDRRDADPLSQTNATVEIVFSTEWKPPSAKTTLVPHSAPIVARP